MTWYHRTTPWAADAILARGFDGTLAMGKQKGIWIADYWDDEYGADNNFRDPMWSSVYLAMDLPAVFPFLHEEPVHGSDRKGKVWLIGTHRLVDEALLNTYRPFRVEHTEYDDDWSPEEFHSLHSGALKNGDAVSAGKWLQLSDFMKRHNRPQ